MIAARARHTKANRTAHFVSVTKCHAAYCANGRRDISAATSAILEFNFACGLAPALRVDDNSHDGLRVSTRLHQVGRRQVLEVWLGWGFQRHQGVPVFWLSQYQQVQPFAGFPLFFTQVSRSGILTIPGFLYGEWLSKSLKTNSAPSKFTVQTKLRGQGNR